MLIIQTLLYMFRQFFAVCLFITFTVYFIALNVCCNHATIDYPAEITFCGWRQMLRNILVNSGSQRNYILEAHLMLFSNLLYRKIELICNFLDHKRLRDCSLVMPLCQKHGVTWIWTQSKDGGSSINNESHYFVEQHRLPSWCNKISIQSFPKSSGDLDKLPLTSLVPSAFMFYNRGSGGSSALMASGSYVRQSNQRIAAA